MNLFSRSHSIEKIASSSDRLRDLISRKPPLQTQALPTPMRARVFRYKRPAQVAARPRQPSTGRVAAPIGAPHVGPFGNAPRGRRSYGKVWRTGQSRSVRRMNPLPKRAGARRSTHPTGCVPAPSPAERQFWRLRARGRRSGRPRHVVRRPATSTSSQIPLPEAQWPGLQLCVPRWVRARRRPSHP